MKWIVVVLLLIALGVVLYFLFKPKKKPETPMESLADLGPMDARKGDTVSVLAMGDDYDDLDFTVDRVNRYRAGGDEWKELSGKYRGSRVFLEVWDDDGVRVRLGRDEDEVPFHTLGLGEPDLIRLDEAVAGLVRVRIGPFSDLAEADRMQALITFADVAGVPLIVRE